ncbi:MAG: MoxR family ATPase [Chloroflexi bacterium]|nr:MoxR family ATPase [Chloroflexota bacterium]
MEGIQDFAERVIENVERVIIGKHAEVELSLIALLCGGHVLVEDVPGVGKTSLAKAVARSIGCSFKRLQFTPDMLPSDITGVFIYNQKTNEFEFRPGPIMAQIVLADEINRATPKTQSALLEAMEEHNVTVEGQTFPLPKPFLVLATQNPIEYEGTFPLPEAQLDRFLMRIELGYPRRADEMTVLETQQRAQPLDEISQVVEVRELVEMQQRTREVYVDRLVREYIVELVNATRQHPDVYLGASPRGSLALDHTAQARATLMGRDYATPDDVKYMAVPTLAHRLIVSPGAGVRNTSTNDVVLELLESVPVPGARV